MSDSPDSPGGPANPAGPGNPGGPENPGGPNGPESPDGPGNRGGSADHAGTNHDGTSHAEVGHAGADPWSGARAAFFDLDKTVIAGSSTLALGRPLYRCGLLTRRLLLRAAYARAMYKVGGADHDRMERMRTELTTLVRGWDAGRLSEVIEQSAPAAIGRLIYPEAVRLIEEHKAAGHDVWLVSSAGEDIVRPVGALLGITNVIATRMTVRDGCYTGAIEFYAYADRKAEAIQKLVADRGYLLDECYAYSDSITDRPMLQTVGRPYAVNPDRELRCVAETEGWPIMDFHRPASARHPITGSGRRTAALGAIGAVAVTGLLWMRRGSSRHGPGSR